MSSALLSESKSQISVIIVLVGIFILFTIGSPQTFLSYNIYYSFMSTIPFFAIMALSLTLVVISGEMDLSFPSIMGFAGWVFTVIFHRTGSPGMALLLALVFGLGAGLMNGLLIVKLKLPSMITTIGTQFFWAGATAVVSGGLGKTLVPAKTSAVYKLLVGRLGGLVPAQMIWTVIIAFFIWFFLNRHRFGAHVYFTGDNPESARVMGVNVDWVKMMVFTQMGLFSAFAGVLASLEVTYYWPTLGQGYLLKTIAAVYLGGTPVDGGVGTIFGTFIGAIILGCLEAGIIAIGMTGFWTQLIYGLIVIVSIAMHSILRKR
ncbi:ABC transporter permease [Atribacter laminatus]|jgi:simple sugar transport system permease protein|uniref:Ribose import permease protein RbsC n=1 Tax=Atribacter laminatus TaxID=2847778 RepID=A0A7T1F266_ATRLM|nr:ABC transporter permease [Atribacter laminatus]QPM67006.1 Ribose import permease protein RbsC [Atribacter laminatus]